MPKVNNMPKSGKASSGGKKGGKVKVTNVKVKGAK